MRKSGASRPRLAVLGSAALLFAAVFGLRLLAGHPADSVTSLYVVPITMVAIESGMTAGIIAGAVALGLFGVWVQLASPEVGVLAYFARGVGFVVTGALTGHMADRLRAAAREKARGARHFALNKDLFCTANFDGYFTDLNSSWEETLGWSREELMARPFLDFVHPEDRGRTEREAGLAMTGDFTASFTNRYRSKFGGWRWIEWSTQVDPAERTIYAVARDVTDRVSAELARREAEERFRRAFEDSATGMAVVSIHADDADGILEVNEAICRIIDRSRAELIGRKSLAEFAHPDDVTAIAEGMRQLVDDEIAVYREEIRLVRPNGEPVWIDLTTSLVRDLEGRALYRISQLQDIDARKRAEDQLRNLAERDPLSGLYNRRRFDQDLKHELAHGSGRRSRGAVLLIDIDNFKAINDSHGHAAGDAVIRHIADTLTQRLRTSDVIARIGGDEFAVLLRRVDTTQAHDVAADLARSIAATPAPNSISVSIGVAAFEGQNTPMPSELMQRADQAMYQAKAAGGSRAVMRPLAHST